MKIKFSKSQWEMVGRKAGWIKTAKNLNVTDEMKQQLTSILPQIMQDIKSIGQIAKNGRKIYPGQIQPRNVVFTDPYSNEKAPTIKTIPISYRTSGTPSLEADSEYSEGEQAIILKIPEDTSIATKNPDGSTNFAVRQQVPAKPFTQADVYNILFHELSHIIDPKTRINHEQGKANSFDQGAKSYYSDPKEIDAFQSEITNSLVNSISQNPNNQQIITNWLKSNQNIDLNQFSVNSNAINAFNYWKKNDPEKIKLLKQRIYSAISKITQKAISKERAMRTSQMTSANQPSPKSGATPSGQTPAPAPQNNPQNNSQTQYNPVAAEQWATSQNDPNLVNFVNKINNAVQSNLSQQWTDQINLITKAMQGDNNALSGAKQIAEKFATQKQGVALEDKKYNGLSEVIDRVLAKTLDSKNPSSLCSINVEGKVICTDPSSLARNQMPNFPGPLAKRFIEEMKKKLGPENVQNIGAVSPDILRNSQDNVVTEVVADILEWDPQKTPEENINSMNTPPTDESSPIIVSNESNPFILDGHHRWAAAKVYNELKNSKISKAGPCYQLKTLNKDQAIKAGLDSENHVKVTDKKDNLKNASDQEKKQGYKYSVPFQAWNKDKKPQKNAYINNNNEYILNGKKAGIYWEQANVPDQNGKIILTGIYFNGEEPVAGTQQSKPTLSYFLNNYIGRIS